MTELRIKLGPGDTPAELVIDQPRPPKLRVRLLDRVVGFVADEVEAMELPEVREYIARHPGGRAEGSKS